MNRLPAHAIAARHIESKVGPLVLLASEDGLAGLYFGHRIDVGSLTDDPQHAALNAAEEQLAEYFAGQRKVFDVPFDMRGTDFQLSVWEQLSLIPHGETASYRDIAERIDNPGAVRAVGLANGNNPISIIVPCHRVIGADGSLTGFGGGLDIKRQLLEHEGLLLLA